MRTAFGLSLVLLATASPLAAHGVEQSARPQVSFAFDRPGLNVPRFTLTLNEDGTGRYEADQVFPAAGNDAPAVQHVDRQVALTPATTARIFAAALALDRFNAACASTAKNIADTGKKTLRYAGPGGDGACSYNYSQDKRVTMLTETFQAIALTLDLGRKLEFEHRFDRLGLDATMATLAEQVDAGRALEVVTIAATLKSIARDSEVLERVRLQAVRLLKQAQVGD